MKTHKKIISLTLLIWICICVAGAFRNGGGRGEVRSVGLDSARQTRLLPVK
jgi:hypothetical protein